MGITIGQLTAIITADSTEFETRMQRVSNILNQTKDDADKSMKAIGSAMLGLGVTISAALTAPLARVGQEVVETGAKFQATMNMLGAVTGATSNELIRMRDLAIQLGADLSLPATSAQDAANAMLVLSKANLSVSDTMAAAKGTLQLAAAAHIDEAQAAQITTDALLAFHLAGEKATQVADLLANASVHTKSNVTDLGAALRNSGAQFQAAKIPIEDLVTSIGLMATAGIRGGQAGTDLKVMLQRLTAPTKEAAESMQRLGIHIFDAHGAILPLRDIIGQFTQKMSALTDASKLHEIQTIFGTRANRAAFDVLLQGIPAYDRMKDVVTKAGGAAELSEVQMRGLSGALEGLQSQVETVALAFGLPLQGGLESVVRLIAQMLPQVAAVIVEFARANPVISAFGVALVALTAVAGPLMIVLGGIIAFVGGPMIAAFAVAATAIAGLATAYAFNLGGLRDAVNGFGQAIAQVFQSLNGQVSGSGITILNILQAIVSTFASTTATLINLIAANVAVMTGHWGAAWEALKRIAAQGSSQTTAATANGLSGIPAAWQTILNKTLGLLNAANANYAGLGARAGASYAAGLVGQLQRSGLSGAMQEGILGASGTPKPLTGFERRPGDKPISIDPFANLPKIDLPKISGGGKVGKAAAIDVLDGFKEGLQGFESAISFLHDKVSTLDGLFDPMSKKARQNSKETVDALRSVASGVNEFLSAQGVAGKINSEEVAKMFSSGNTSLIEYATNWQKNSETVRQAGIEMATQLHAPLKEVNDALKASGFDIQLSAEMWSKLSDVNKQNFIDISDVVAAQRLANEETKNSSGVISEATQAIVNHSAQQKNALLLYQQGILTGSEFIAMLTGLEPAIEKVGASAELTGQKVKSLLTLLKEKIDKDNIFAKLQEQNDIAQFTGNVIREFETMAQHLNFTTEQTTSYVLNNVRSVLGQMPPEVKAIAEQVLRNWADGFNRLPGVLDNVVNRALDSLGKFDIATRLKFKGTVSGVLDVLENLPGQFGSKLKRITDTVLSWINSIDKVFGGLHKVFDSVPDGIAGMLSKVIGLFKNASSSVNGGGIFGAIGGFFGKLFGGGGSGAAGTSISDGMASNAGGGILKSLGGVLGIAGIGASLLPAIIGLFKGKSQIQKDTEKTQLEQLKANLAKTYEDVKQGMIETMQKGAELLKTLEGYVDVPRKAIKRFLNQLFLVLEMFVDMSKEFKAEGLEAGKAVVENLGGAFDFLLSGATLIEAIKNLASITDKNIADFIATTTKVISKWLAAASEIELGAAKFTGKISDKLKTSFEFLKIVPEVIKGIAESAMVDDAAIDGVFATAQKIVSKMKALSEDERGLALNKAAASSERFRAIFDSIKTAVEAIKAVADVGNLEDSIWGKFQAYIETMVNTLSESLRLMDTASTLAANFKGLADSIKENTLAGIESIKAVAGALAALLGGGKVGVTANVTYGGALGSVGTPYIPSGKSIGRGDGQISGATVSGNTFNVMVDLSKYRHLDELIEDVTRLFGRGGSLSTAAQSV